MLGGTETGVQNKLHDVPVTQRCIGGHQAALDRFGAHFFQADAATVVHKTQQHLASLSGQTQNKSSALALALAGALFWRSEEHTSELQSRGHLVCRLLLEERTP